MTVEFYIAKSAKLILAVGSNLTDIPIGQLLVSPDNIAPANIFFGEGEECFQFVERIKHHLTGQGFGGAEREINVTLNDTFEESFKSRRKIRISGSFVNFLSEHLKNMAVVCCMDEFSSKILHKSNTTVQSNINLISQFMSLRRDVDTNELVLEDSFEKLDPLPTVHRPSNLWTNTKELQPEEVQTCTITLKIKGTVNPISEEPSCNQENQKLEHESESLKDLAQFYKQVLQDEVETNATIVLPSGTEKKCHKFLLMACSPVFCSMVEKQKELDVCKIELAGIGDTVATALFAFLYHGDVSVPFENLEVSLELLQLSKDYQIERLENHITKILLSKGVECFTAVQGLRLFLISRESEKLIALTNKAVEILKGKHGGSTEEYKEILRSHPEAAVQLCSQLLE